MTNQHLAYERYLWFDNEIQKKHYPNAVTLAREFEISVRTAQRAIEFMRDRIEAPLVYDPRRRGYTYETPFRLAGLPLSQAELLAVLLARELVSASDSGFISRAIRRFGAKIFQKDKGLGISERMISQCFSAVWHGYAPSEALVFRHVSRALLAGQLLAITYCSPHTDQVSERIVEPHHLQHYMGSWILLAWCRLRNDWRRFYLSRMQRTCVKDETFDWRPSSTWRPLLDRGFGVFQGPELSEVKILFSSRMARLVREQVWHPSQKQDERPDGSLVLTIPVADLREIKMKILQFGPAARVLEPRQLVELIKEDARGIVEMYKKNPLP